MSRLPLLKGCAGGYAPGGQVQLVGGRPKRRWGTCIALAIVGIIALVVVAAVVVGLLGRMFRGGGAPTHLIGKPAPDFVADTLSGETVRLQDYRGKVVLLDFWASWCMPCRQEMPNVVRIHNRYGSRGLQVIGINLDTNRAEASQFVSAEGLTWPHVRDDWGSPSGVAGKYGVEAIPMTFIIDRDGTIIDVGLRGGQLEARIAEALGET